MKDGKTLLPTRGELGRKVIWLPSVDSTNRYLKDEGEALPHGTLCYTDCQTAGRGRLGREWSVPAGGSLAMSLLLRMGREDLPLTALRPLPLLCGMAVCEALASLTGGVFRLKWPNDSICGGRKVCGILCESRPTADGYLVVAGIGVNLTQPAEWFESAGLPEGGSVAMLTGVTLSPGETAAEILSRLEPLWQTFKREGFAPLREGYASLCLNLGRPVQVLSPDGQVRLEGKAVGVDAGGALLIEGPHGVQPVEEGEVSLRGMDGYF